MWVGFTVSILRYAFGPKHWPFESFNVVENYGCFRILLTYK